MSRASSHRNRPFSVSTPIFPVDSSHTLRALIVDDSPTNCLVAAAMLRELGIEADTATSAAQSIALAGKTAYALILMDLSLGDRSGVSAACDIRALGGHNREVPIIAVTAHSAADERAGCLAAGMNDFMQKPIEIRPLDALVRRWCGMAPSEGLFPSRRSRVPAASGFDREAIEMLRQGLTPDGFALLVSRFATESEARIERLRTAAVSQDHATLARESHALKSGAALFGALELSRAAADIEVIAQRRDNAIAPVETLAVLARAAHNWLRSFGR